MQLFGSFCKRARPQPAKKSQVSFLFDYFLKGQRVSNAMKFSGNMKMKMKIRMKIKIKMNRKREEREEDEDEDTTRYSESCNYRIQLHHCTAF